MGWFVWLRNAGLTAGRMIDMPRHHDWISLVSTSILEESAL